MTWNRYGLLCAAVFVLVAAMTILLVPDDPGQPVPVSLPLVAR